MTAQPEGLNRIEIEAVYRIRELFAEGREAALCAAGEEEEFFADELASLALYPEKPLLSFVKEYEEDVEEPVWNPERLDMDFFRLAKQFQGKSQVHKLIACGGVDDGKSTLIGRILFDTMRKEEKEQIQKNPDYLRKDGTVDYALLAGVTEEEARQGITVQVSFSTFDCKDKSFLIADVPGHEEYTRNMAYAALGADTAVIMIGANKGIVPQTRRHTRICCFMGIRNMIFAVNKMDMVSYDQTVFCQLCEEIEHLMEEFEDCSYKIIPVAAKSGENIIKASEKMIWHQNGTLLDALMHDGEQTREKDAYFCMMVQRMCKSSQMKDAVIKKRVIQGEAVSGRIQTGDEIFVYPTARRAKVSAIYCLNHKTDAAEANMPIGLELDRELDVARGYILTQGDILTVTDRVEADLLWTFDNRLTQGKRYRIQIGTATATAVVTKIFYQMDVNTGEHRYTEYLTKNALARCEIRFSRQVAVSCEKECRALGTIRLIDRETDSLAAYGNIVHTISEEAWKEDARKVTARERESALGQRAGMILFGLGEKSGEQMNYVERYLLCMGFHTIQSVPDVLDQRETYMLRSFLDAGLIVLVRLKQEEKEAAVNLIEEKKYIFDCMKSTENLEDMGGILKKIKVWSSELI